MYGPKFFIPILKRNFELISGRPAGKMRTACLQLCLLFGSSFVAISHQRHRVKKAPAEHTFGPSDDGKNTTKQLLTNNLLSRFIVVPEVSVSRCVL